MSPANSLRHKRTFRLLSVPALVFLLALSGCAALRPQPPEVSLIGVRVISIGLLEQHLALKLNVHNPNPRTVDITRLDYRIELEDRPFAEGVLTEEFTLPAEGDAEIELPARARLDQLLDGLMEQLGNWIAGKGSGGIRYRVRGVVEIRGIGPVPFDRSGKAGAFPKSPIDPERKPPAQMKT